MNILYRFFVLPTLAVSIALGASAAWAEKPDWAGGGKHEKKHGEKGKSGGDGDRDASLRVSVGGVDIRIGDRDRELFHDYYRTQAKAGHCPPGLAKKGNGCLPPGQAKKWSRGQALPRGIEIYDLPHDLQVRLPIPPAGHRYVRVAADVLLIAVGTGMVVDAVEDLMR